MQAGITMCRREREASGRNPPCQIESGRAARQRGAPAENLRRLSVFSLWKGRSRSEKRLLAQTKAFDNLAIPIRVPAIEVVQQTAAPVHHHNEPPPRCMVFYVRLEMRGEVD